MIGFALGGVFGTACSLGVGRWSGLGAAVLPGCIAIAATRVRTLDGEEQAEGGGESSS